MITKHVHRLYCWADHIEFCDLAHERFDMRYFSVGTRADNGIAPATCGSAGCASGELPAAFPNEWEWYAISWIRRIGLGQHILVRLKGTEEQGVSALAQVCEFFGMTEKQARYICMTESYVEPPTRLEVADRIREVADNPSY